MSEIDLTNKNVKTHSMTRRVFLATAAAAIIGTGGYEAAFEGDNLQTTRTVVHLPNWPAEAEGLKIGLISDFHADSERAIKRTERAAQMLMAEKPDIAFAAGDFVTNHFSLKYVARVVSALQSLTASPKGAFAVMGNHDHWSNTAGLSGRLLEKIGFTVLSNLAVALAGAPNVYIVGVDDAMCRKMDIGKALRGVPKDARKIIAIHEPDYADSIGEGFDLQLSGHSHGGQICLPFLPPLHTPAGGRKYPEGLMRARRHLVYTTRGVGMVGPQIRSFCPPEVTILTLKSE